MPRALLSVSDKAGLVPFARGLVSRGVELVSTGGTATALAAAGLPVLGISDVTGFPEMMDGRVKTLHPMVHGGILARRAVPSHMAAAAAHGIAMIDLVVVNLYPFVAAAANPETTVDDLIEQIDIGGPSLLRGAAKNFHDVLVVVSPSDYDAVLEQWDRLGGPSLEFRFGLASKAFAHTGEYDRAIAATLSTVSVGPQGLSRDTGLISEALPGTLSPDLRKVRDLRYGENPHQRGAWYAAEGATGLGRALVLQGKELSYTNLLDLDAAGRLALEFDEPAAVVVKHTNPCGAATGCSAADAYVRAREADARAAFGGIVALNRPIDVDAARAIVSTFIEAVLAPAVDADARAVLASKPNMRVVTADLNAVSGPCLELRSILGAVLVQERDRVSEAASAWPVEGLRVVTARHPTADEWRALRFAWRVTAHVKSNTVVFTAADRTIAVGAGQMSRVDAVQVARMKAASIGPGALRGSVAGSDAFFPFRDGLDALAAAGATAVVQPGGSVRDDEVIKAADEHGLTMVFTGRRHFRH